MTPKGDQDQTHHQSKGRRTVAQRLGRAPSAPTLRRLDIPGGFPAALTPGPVTAPPDAVIKAFKGETTAAPCLPSFFYRF